MTQSELKKLVIYDPETGFIKWKNPLKNRKLRPNNVSDGYITKYGYLVFFINHKTYRAHRLAWLYMTGGFPKNQIDHIDGNRVNNKFANLREVTSQQNSFNTKAKGYTFNKKTNQYMVRIGLNRKRIYLGVFKTEKDAKEAYLNAKLKHHGKEFSVRALVTI